jgi:4-amino-4-deoxy-L-arabinose transferase-like glycosyltransferase
VAVPQEIVRTSDVEGARVFFAVLTNALIAALCCLIFWSLLRRFGLSRKWALWAACLLGFATPLWVYARDFFAEPLFTACLIGAFYLATQGGKNKSPRTIVLAGLATSLGFLARASFIPIAAIVAAYIALSAGEARRGARQAAWYAAACLPGLAAVAALNLWRFGGVFLTGYHTAFDKGFSVPFAKGLLWNLASPYRGVLLFAPAVVIFALGIHGFAKRHRAEAWLAISVIAYIFVLYSKWWAWHGGWCWGPRFLVPVIPLLLVPGLVEARTKKWLAATAVILGLVGFGVQVAGVLINYTTAYDYWIKIKRLDWAEANIQTFSPMAIHLKALSATSPRQYDLWAVQAARVIGWHVLWIVFGLAAVAWVSASRIVRPASRV